MTIGFWAFAVGFLLLIAAAFFWMRSQQWQTRSGLPQGNIIYTDVGAWFPNQDALYDAELKLVGKPDYLIEQESGDIIPVELKSGRAPQEPPSGCEWLSALHNLPDVPPVSLAALIRSGGAKRTARILRAVGGFIRWDLPFTAPRTPGRQSFREHSGQGTGVLSSARHGGDNDQSQRQPRVVE